MAHKQVMKQALEAWDNPMGMAALCVAMDALRKALEQPEQGPVAERFEAMHSNGDVWITTIAAAQIARSTTLPAAQRQWVGLTDDDFQSICANFRVAHGGWVDMLVLQIEAKLKEKNNA